MDLIEATKKAILGILTESTNAKLDINKIAEFLKEEVEVLTTSKYTCGWYELDRDLAIFVGWTAGYDPNDEDYIHAKDDPTFVLAAKIASTHEYMKTDLDWLTQPYYEDGEVWDTEITLTETSNFKADADWFIKSYKGIRKALDNGELLLENKRRATRIYNKAMNKNIESKQLKTEATTNLDDMYDEYKEAYHKDLDIKTVPCVIARDKMLSGWGRAKNTTHYQMVLCADDIEANNIASNMKIKAKSDGLANIRVDFGIKIPRNGSVSYSVGRNARAWNMSDSWYKRYDRPAEKKEEARSHKEDNEKVAPRTSIEKEYMHNNANFGIYNDKDAKKFNQDSYKEPVNAKRNKIRNYKDSETITHTSYEKSPNKQTQLYKDLKDLGYIKSTKKVTEATLDLDDMYDEYKKAYNKDLDTKRVPCVIARDIMLSGWGGAEGKNHYQVVLCADTTEARNIEYNMRAKAKQEQLANVRTSIGIQLPRNASVAYTVGRYAPAWNMGDSWYESRFGKVEEGRYKLDVVKYNMLHDKFKNDKRSYDELSDAEKEELNTYRDLTKKVYNSTRDHKDIKSEAIETQDIQSHTTAGDTDEERAYYGKNMTKRDKVRSLDQAKRNLDKVNNGDDKINARQVMDQVSYDNLPDADLQTYKYRKDMASIYSGEGPKYNKDLRIDGKSKLEPSERNEMVSMMWDNEADEVADKIRAKHIAKTTKREAIETQNIQSHTTAGDNEDERAYYGKNLTKRDKIRSLDQAKRNLDRANKGDERVQAKQVYDQVSYDNLPDSKLDAYKYNKDLAKKAKERGDDFWEKEHNDTAKSFAKDMKYRHMARQANKKQEARNPENDKVNAMIRTTLNGSTKYVKDLEDLGFVLDRYGSNGKVSSIHHKDNDEYLYRGKMMGLDKNADLYNYLTKKRPTDWDDRTNSGFEVQKNMSSEKDLADGGYSSNGFTSTVGKSIPKRFKTNKSSIVVTEPYGSKKVKQYKKINADIASKKADIKEIQDDVDGLYADVSEKQNNIVNAQNDINQLEKDKQALLQKTEARSNKADNEKASPRDSYKTAIISDDTSFPENELDIDLGLNTKRNRVRSQKQADSNYEKAEKELNKGKNSDLSKVGHNTFTRMSYEVSPNEDLRIYKNMRDVAKAYRSRDNDDETANMYDDYADEMANKIRTKQSKQKTEALSRDDYIRIENEPRTENYKKGLKIRDEIVNAWKKGDLKTAYDKWSELYDLFSTGYDDEGNQTADWSEEQSARDIIELTAITDTIEDNCVYDVTDYGKAKAYKEMGY